MAAVTNGEFAMGSGYSGAICPEILCSETIQPVACQVVSPFNGINPQEDLCPAQGLCPRAVYPIGVCQQELYPEDICEKEQCPHENRFYPVHLSDGEQYQGDTYPRELCRQHGLEQNGISPGRVLPEAQYLGDILPQEAYQREQALQPQDLPACAYDKASYPLPGSHFPMSFSHNLADGDDDYSMMNGGQVSNEWLHLVAQEMHRVDGWITFRRIIF